MGLESRPIALFLPSLRGGGAERVMINLAQGFVEHGVKVDLLLAQNEGPFLDKVPPTARLIDLNARKVRYTIPALTRYLRWARPLAALSAMDHANIALLLASRLAGGDTRIIASLHNTPSELYHGHSRFSRWRFGKLLRLFYPWADGVVAVSRGVAEDYVATTGIDRSNLRVIYNPVVTPDLLQHAAEPLHHHWFAPGEPPVIIAVGSLTEQKDFSTLLHAFARLRQRRAARLLILGEGELRSDLETLAASLSLGSDLSMPGFVNNPFNHMAKAATFVLSSRWEGLPTVLIEALAVGVPVVATDCRSGPQEILQEGRYGRLVPVGDVEALALALQQSLESSPGRPSTEGVESYRRERVVNQYLQLLRGEMG